MQLLLLSSETHHYLIFNKSLVAKPLFRCNLSLPSKIPISLVEPDPIFTSVKAFALATIVNLGPGFDFLGCAVDGLGNFVSLSADPYVPPGEISISDISGDSNVKKLSKDLLWNCAGIAAIEVMKMLGIRFVGLSLSLEKGLPLGRGLRSTATSATAVVVAVNEIFGNKLGVEELTSYHLKIRRKGFRLSHQQYGTVVLAITGGFVLMSQQPDQHTDTKFKGKHWVSIWIPNKTLKNHYLTLIYTKLSIFC